MDRRHLYFLLFLLCTIQAAIGQQHSFSIKGVDKRRIERTADTFR